MSVFMDSNLLSVQHAADYESDKLLINVNADFIVFSFCYSSDVLKVW